MGIYNSKSFATSDNVQLKTSARDLESITMTPPPEFGGPEGYWTPEDLFSASISSCYILSFKALARAKKMDWESLDVKVDAKLEKTKTGLKFTKVDIYSHLEICCKDNIDPYLELLMKTKDICLVTNSMNCEFTVHPKIRLKLVK